MKNQIVRQGDVLLVPVKKIPETATVDARTNGRCILAHGEVTGHAHVIDVPTEQMKYLMTPEGERFLAKIRSDIEPPLTHEEHGKVFVTGDLMQQGFQVEDYGTEVRRVAD